ncbi:MAG: 2-octaprenyl-6-methoxyphenyl hydroxylase [Rhodanobacteraceae bacterium]|nr:MAG: 2-octaprenyl-6-methoxyphenyl hydroxylase [Rhodanobacteraceae bacterium]
MMPDSVEILIVGGGLVGTSLALALDATGIDVALVEAAPPRAPSLPAAEDNDRNLVLARASVNALRALGVWPHLAAMAGTIRRLEVSRAGEFGRFRVAAADAGVDALGRVVPGRVLAAALEARLHECRHVQRLAPARLLSLAPVATGWRAVVLADGAECTLDARLVVGADGSHSLVRAQIGIAARKHDYAQSLFVCTVGCGREVPDCAFERFTDAGPVALLPLPHGRRGLVLTVTADQHEAVAVMDDAAFVALAQQRCGWKLGALTRPGKRFAHRIQRVLADALTAPRAVLVGNAAQTVHPIGAQGFNLGLRDALTLAELLDGAPDPGAGALLGAYAARRRPDRDGVVAFSHGLIALGCLAQPVLSPLRSLALLALDRMPPLRHAVARHGMGFRGLPPAAVLDAGP